MLTDARARWVGPVRRLVSSGRPVSPRRAPVSYALAGATIATAVIHSAIPRHWHHYFTTATMYRGTDLEHGVLWRLPLSAFLVHSPADLLWTVTLMLTLFAWLERRVGHTALLLITMGSHVTSTLMIDWVAYDERWHSWLTERDFGTSCLVMGVIAASIVATRHPALIGGLVVVLAVDVRMNSSMTIAEHLVALATGAAVCAAYLMFLSLALNARRAIGPRSLTTSTRTPN